MASVFAAVCRRKVTVNRSSLTPFVRISPMGNGETPRTGNASEDGIGEAACTSETYCHASVFISPFPNKNFIALSVTRCPGLSALGIDCKICLPALSDFTDYAGRALQYHFLEPLWNLLSMLIMWLHVFTVLESMLLIIVQSTNDFNLLAYVNVLRRRYSFCFGQKNLHSSLRSVVFFHPRPNISLQRLTPCGCQASETDGDIQIKKTSHDENEQPHK